MSDPNEWDAPDPPRLLVSAKRVAAELDIPIWKANEVCWCLDRRFYSPGQSHFRVTVASLESLKDLLNLGLDLGGARAVMWHFKTRGDLPPSDLSLEEARRIYWLARRRW